jgi:DDE superfamily endonuclease
MKETTPAAMPPCFDRWCQRFDDIFGHIAQKREFRNYLGGLLGESERKNLKQMATNAVGVTYHKLHHFLTAAPWSFSELNQRRLEVMNQCRQTKINQGFSLIVDDSGHRKSGNFTEVVGRQYIGEIGKTENGVVAVTTHLYDGIKSLPLDIELYQKADSLPKGNADPEFKKKPEIAIDLIDQSLARGYRPGIVLIDAGYGNNASFLQEVEKRKLKYIGGIAKNRKVIIQKKGDEKEEIRVDNLAITLPKEAFSKIQLQLEKPRTVWVATREIELSKYTGKRVVAIVMNAATSDEASEIDYLMSNVELSTATGEWVVKTYSQRNWVEVFYREAKGWLGLKEYQVRDKRSLMRHLILVFCAYTFILWHTLTGGLRRKWANKPLNTFTEALEAFRTAISFRFVKWLNKNLDVFSAYKASLGFIWA